MCAETGHGDRAAVPVVSGVVDVLHARGDIDSAPDVSRVVGFQNVFPPVGQGAVAKKETKSSIRQVGLMVLDDAVGNECDAGSILLAMPLCAVDTYAFQKGFVNFGVGE